MTGRQTVRVQPNGLSFPNLEELRRRARRREALTGFAMCSAYGVGTGFVVLLAAAVGWLVQSGSGWLLGFLRDKGLWLPDVVAAVFPFF